ncbi:hypothetical protein Kisp01_23470 [Kineosporia sp. NBRC 101677]|nr:hypothetical protein [Kineosporia sp. NBRC 101677]GLY15332.1 hypothetical protein Kisp01_23470 [Kineosporia sp. NBRC 101677]
MESSSSLPPGEPVVPLAQPFAAVLTMLESDENAGVCDADGVCN